MTYDQIIEDYREKARNRQITLKDQILYHIAKASFRDPESIADFEQSAAYSIVRMFTPAKRANKLANNYNNNGYFKLVNALQGFIPRKHGFNRNHVPNIRSTWIGIGHEATPLYPQPILDQIARVAELARDILVRKYLYIFVRNDMSPEQIAVQTAHATFVAGCNLRGQYNAADTHFVVIGLPYYELLAARGKVASFGGELHPFYESNMNDELTAFTTGIITQDKRYLFRGYPLLKIGG